MAEHLLRARPVSVANHVEARQLLIEGAVAWLASESGRARSKRSAICRGKLCGGTIIFGQCCPCGLMPLCCEPAFPAGFALPSCRCIWFLLCYVDRITRIMLAALQNATVGISSGKFCCRVWVDIFWLQPVDVYNPIQQLDSYQFARHSGDRQIRAGRVYWLGELLPSWSTL